MAHQIRYVAGCYWIWKVGQCELPYLPPYRTNACGALIWEGLCSGKTVEEIARQLSDVYGILYQDACMDVGEFIQELRDKKLMIENE